MYLEVKDLLAQRGAECLYLTTSFRAVPALQIWGDRDPYLGPELFTGAERFAPGLTSLHLPGAGHWAHQWAPDQVNSALLAFFGGATP